MKRLQQVFRRVLKSQVTQQPVGAPVLLSADDLKKVAGGLPAVGGLIKGTETTLPAVGGLRS